MSSLWCYIVAHRGIAIFVAIALAGWIALLIVIPIVVSSLPADYFFCDNDLLGTNDLDHSTIPAGPMRFMRNTLALFLIFVAPILFQSIFAPIIGLAIGEFKWKHKALKRLGRSRRIVAALNSIRTRNNRPPFTQLATTEGDADGKQ